MTSTPPTACILIIGDEILSGRTQDTNIRYLAERLGALGIRLKEARVIPDVAEVIIATVNDMRRRHTYVFTTGGIGPTHDDITTDCIAAAFGRKVVRHPKVVAAMQAYFGDRANEARLRMANIPDGPDVALIDNRLSIAPGYRIENVFVLAGVPSIAQAMFEALEPTLTKGDPVYSQSVDAEIGEGDIADALTAIQNAHPAVAIGSYPYGRSGKICTSIVARSTDRTEIAFVIDEVAAAMRIHHAEPVFGPAP
ncbi:MAG: competence/damage-inducible protein A [Rhodospirillaceae bacterium]|nr:MAG: competence/damage-inducible protein A [Rhodospirillaceae bacterium]